MTSTLKLVIIYIYIHTHTHTHTYAYIGNWRRKCCISNIHSF